MPDLNDFHAFQSTSGDDDSGGNGNGGKRGRGFGWGWGVIVIVAVLLIFFIFNGASWEAIETLLALGLIAFLFFRWIST